MVWYIYYFAKMPIVQQLPICSKLILTIIATKKLNCTCCLNEINKNEKHLKGRKKMKVAHLNIIEALLPISVRITLLVNWSCVQQVLLELKVN